jgi:hypothetical protein
MATVKAYSVAKTDGTATASTVYSLQSGSPNIDGSTTSSGAVPSTGRNGAYDHNDAAGRVEARTPTLVTCGQTLTGQALASQPFSAQTAAGTALGDAAPPSTTVVCTTTTITGTGAGLIVTFTTTAAGAIPAVANITATEVGAGYSDGDTVQIDGWVGSIFVVDEA